MANVDTNRSGSSGTNQNPAGGNPDPNQNGDVTDPKDGDKVAFETHRKLLAEKKQVAAENAALKSRLDALEADNRKREEADLKAKEDWQKLAELREKESAELKAQVEENKRIFADAKKIDGFTKSLGASIPSQYLGLIDTNEILIDPATGKVDEGSVTKAVENFRARYPEIIGTRKGSLPAGAPAGSGGGLTYEAWLKLPPKEMVARKSEVIDK